MIEIARQVGVQPERHGHNYSLAVAVVALFMTVSAVPFSSILVLAVLLRRERWLEIAVLSSFGSAAGAVMLYLLVHHLAWSEIAVAYPDLSKSKAWEDTVQWISVHGVWALLVIAATPLPQTPALIFTAISQLPLAEVFLAVLLGKLIKYGLYGLLAARFPFWFERFLPIENAKRL